jgi:hypothetical protein
MVKVGIIGCGYWGKNLVRNFHLLEAREAIHNTNPQVMAAMSAQYGAPALDLDVILTIMRAMSYSVRPLPLRPPPRSLRSFTRRLRQRHRCAAAWPDGQRRWTTHPYLDEATVERIVDEVRGLVGSG